MEVSIGENLKDYLIEGHHEDVGEDTWELPAEEVVEREAEVIHKGRHKVGKKEDSDH
jgi:hypothetical protein